MNNLQLNLSLKECVVAASLALILVGALAPASDARGFRARGANGATGAYGRSSANSRSGAAAAVGYNRGAAFRAGSWSRASKFAAQGVAGGSASGYSNNVYNAQTGTGTRNSGKDFNSASGQSYGYDGSTSYAKGQGTTSTIDTQNKGDYSVDWQKGSKPIVTPTGL